MKKAKLPKVTFCIPTLNAAWILPRCLNAIREQDYPQNLVEIIIADGGSKDKTREIAKKYHAKIIPNPEILHEQGKSRASKAAKGQILFFTDADNILVSNDWIKQMVKPFINGENVQGFLPQTQPPKDSCSLNRYLGYLFTDPFTAFVYGNGANPKDYEKMYKPVKKTPDYIIYKFPVKQLPVFGLSQGVGTVATYKKTKIGKNDDMLAGIKLIQEGGKIAYIPNAGVYHYHVKGFSDFIKKYRWRLRNNLQQQVKQMGYINRIKYLNQQQKTRQFLFIPYSLSIILPFLTAIKLTFKYKDFVMFWHPIVCFVLGVLLLMEYTRFKLGFIPQLHKEYGK